MKAFGCGALLVWAALATTAMATDWETRQWMEKASQKLRYHQPITEKDNPKELAKKSRREIISYLMAQPEFDDTFVDFGNYLVGTQNENFLRVTHEGDKYYRLSGIHSGVLNSLHQYHRDGDLFSIVASKHPRPARALNLTQAIQEYPPEERTPELKAKYWGQGLDNLVDVTLPKLIHLFDPENPTENNDRCQTFQGMSEESFEAFSAAGLEDAVSFLEFLQLSVTCTASMRREGPQSYRDKFEIIKRDIEKTRAWHTDPYFLTPAIQDLKKVRNYPEGHGLSTQQSFYSALWFELANSSTNFNRKRAAYALKHFFCDDLTPIGVALPSSHSSSGHGSDPSCQACHYKLDPMAGFFKDKGLFGVDFSKADFFVFDDQAVKFGETLQHFYDSWRAAPGSGREWNIGFITSAIDPSHNQYGENLDDLHRIVHDSSRFRKCYVKRLTEYFIGKDQAIHGGYIDHLARHLLQVPKDGANSKRALQQTITELLLSKTFATPDPDPKVCYDFAPGYEPSGLPCSVSHVIEKNCTSCHEGEGASGGLDLTKWIDHPQGGKVFSHKPDGEHQLPRGVTFLRISERLSSTDPDLAMPLSTHMDPLDREALYRWVIEQSAQGGE